MKDSDENVAHLTVYFHIRKNIKKNPLHTKMKRFLAKRQSKSYVCDDKSRKTHILTWHLR